MKKLILVGFILITLLVVAIAALFLKQFPDKELVTISASVGNLDDCGIGGSSKVKGVGSFAWWYFNLPGVSQSYLEEGNSFLSSAFDALICKEDQPGYAENLKRVKRLVIHGKKLGESVDDVGENGFNLLHGAVIKGDVTFAGFLLDQGADPSAKTAEDAVWYGKDYQEKTALELAEALRGNNWPVSDEIVELLTKNI